MLDDETIFNNTLRVILSKYDTMCHYYILDGLNGHICVVEV